MRSFSVRSTLFRKKTKKTLRQKACQRLEKNRVKQINSPLEIKGFFITGLVASDLQPWPGPDCKRFAFRRVKKKKNYFLFELGMAAFGAKKQKNLLTLSPRRLIFFA
jgi:hypothetical protein